MGEMRSWAVPLLINFSIDMASQGTWKCKVRLKFSVHWFLPHPSAALSRETGKQQLHKLTFGIY